MSDNDYYKITNNSNLLRHAASKGVVNNDLEGLRKYREERDRMKKINSLANEQNNLKNQINDINTKLELILSKLENSR